MAMGEATVFAVWCNHPGCEEEVLVTVHGYPELIDERRACAYAARAARRQGWDSDPGDMRGETAVDYCPEHGRG